MKLVVGLGNIGKKYEYTRHNIGFLCVDTLVQRFGFEPFRSEKKFFGQISRGQIGHQKIIALKPETYMNFSGKSIQALRKYYKISIDDIWIFSDDVDMMFGKVRFRAKGQSGGHNGLKSIIQVLGNDGFSRVKVGIGNTHFSHIPTDRFVLGKFETEEKKQISEIINLALQKFLTHCSC
jgi:PTH1 family peptidyl-tRNA hydrolase